MARKKKQTPDSPPENVDNTDDTFGLPEVEYEPLKRDEAQKPEEIAKPEEPETPEEEPVASEDPAPEVVVIDEAPEATPEPPVVEQPAFKFSEHEPAHDEHHKGNEFAAKNSFDEDRPYQPSYNYQRETPDIWPKVIGVLLVLIILGGAVWYFAFYHPQQLVDEEKERKELLQIQEEARRREAERQEAARRAEEERANPPVEPTAAPAVGSIETLSARSGRYYVVVASSIDGDLIMDYAKKLSQKGVSTMIIPPFGKSSFHRLAVAEGDTYETTQAAADGLKGGEYGDKVWVVKY